MDDRGYLNTFRLVIDRQRRRTNAPMHLCPMKRWSHRDCLVIQRRPGPLTPLTTTSLQDRIIPLVSRIQTSSLLICNPSRTQPMEEPVQMTRLVLKTARTSRTFQTRWRPMSRARTAALPNSQLPAHLPPPIVPMRQAMSNGRTRTQGSPPGFESGFSGLPHDTSQIALCAVNAANIINMDRCAPLQRSSGVRPRQRSTAHLTVFETTPLSLVQAVQIRSRFLPCAQDGQMNSRQARQTRRRRVSVKNCLQVEHDAGGPVVLLYGSCIVVHWRRADTQVRRSRASRACTISDFRLRTIWIGVWLCDRCAAWLLATKSFTNTRSLPMSSRFRTRYRHARPATGTQNSRTLSNRKHVFGTVFPFFSSCSQGRCVRIVQGQRHVVSKRYRAFAMEGAQVGFDNLLGADLLKRQTRASPDVGRIQSLHDRGQHGDQGGPCRRPARQDRDVRLQRNQDG